MNRRGFFGRLFGAAAAAATAPLAAKAVAKKVTAQPLVGSSSYVLMNSTTSYTVDERDMGWWDREDDYDEDDD